MDLQAIFMHIIMSLHDDYCVYISVSREVIHI